MNPQRFWQVMRALVIISKQVHSCEKMLRQLLKHHEVDYSAEDAAVLQITDDVKEAKERLPKPPEPKQPTGDK